MFGNKEISFGEDNKLVLKMVAVATVITALAGGYYFFVNSVWKPHVEVISADFENGFAKLHLPFGRTIDIYGDSPFFINGDWGVKFGTINQQGKVKYQNIQLTKRGLVVEYLKVPVSVLTENKT